MYDPPAYLWAITIAGPTAIAALTCIVLYGGAERAGLGRRRAALLAGAAAVLLGGWFSATAVIADHGWYHTLPWFPVAVAGFLGTLLALSRIPVVARALTAPGLIEPLSGRELEVLRLLAAGRSNQRIAHDLFVALDTVKKHVTHVLGKLGAANRTEAVARARDLGLIP